MDERAVWERLVARIAADLAGRAEPAIRVAVATDDDDPTLFSLEIRTADRYVERIYLEVDEGQEQAALSAASRRRPFPARRTGRTGGSLGVPDRSSLAVRDR